MTAKLGFLSVRKHADHGYFGGYLVVNHLARPLEFHCTMPVKPSRAQILLYGPTIEDFVCGEQIAKALVTKAKVKPDLVLTDTTPVLALSVVSGLPALKVSSDRASSSSSGSLTVPVASNLATRSMTARGTQFTAPERLDFTEQQLSEVLETLSDSVDLTEPFQRIVDALLEAHPIAKAA